MIVKFSNHKAMKLLSMLSAVNFNAAVIFLLIVSVISAVGSSAIFDNNNELYGPLAGNLRLMLIYLTLSQFAAYCFCGCSQNYCPLIAVGMFWLLMMGAIEFYGMINQIPIDENYGWLFLYLGFSNLVYGGTMLFSNSHQDVN